MQARFEVSDAFEGIPIGMDQESTRVYLLQQYRQHGAAEDELDPALVRTVHTVSRMLRATGALFVGSSLRLLDGAPSSANLLVAVRKFDFGDDTRIAAEGTLHSLVAARGKGWSGGVYDLPCGPGAVVTGGRRHEVPWKDESKPPFVARVAELQAYIPVSTSPAPADRYLLMVSFSTPDITHWDAYMPSVVRLLRTISLVAEQPQPVST